MFVFLCLAFFATAQASPVGKIIPVFEDVTNLRPHFDHRPAHRTLCFEDCHHHILNKPMFVVRSTHYPIGAPTTQFAGPNRGAHSHYAPIGLNGLAKSPLTMPLHEAILSSESNVAVIFPFARFPFELFPGLYDSELVVPEHVTTLNHMYKEAPIVAFFPEEEFRKINEHRGFIQVADFSVDSTGFTVAEDYALVNRNAALAVSHVPVANHDVAPAVVHAVQPAAFTTGPPKSVYPITGGFLQYTGNGFSVGGETQRNIPYAPAGTTYYTSVPSISF